MTVRNIFVVELDVDRSRPGAPAFKKVIVGPLPMKEDIIVTLDWLWAALALVLAVLALVAGS